jgi:hypothetical protein
LLRHGGPQWVVEKPWGVESSKSAAATAP